MSRREGRDPALLLRSGRRWREAPDEGASEASCSCPSRQHQKHASLRSRPLIRPPGTFSREREKGFFPSHRQQRPDQPFSCAAGQELLFQSPAATSGTSPSPAQREKVARSAGRGREGSELLLPFQATSKARFAALAPPHPPSGHLLP